MIDLYDLADGGRYLDEAYVRGHVDALAFRCAVNDQLLGEMDDPESVPEYGPIRHVWARWQFDGQDDFGAPRRVLAEHRKPGRGCFPVTAATLASLLRRQEATKAQGDRDVADLLTRYPGVTVERRNDYGRDYWLRVPGVPDVVQVGWRDWRPYTERQGRPPEVTFAVWPRGMDIEAWNTYTRSKHDPSPEASPDQHGHR